MTTPGAISRPTGTDGAVLVWDAAKGVLRHILVRHKGVVHAVAFSPLSGQLATAGFDGTIRIWDPDTGEHVHVHERVGVPRQGLAFSPADGALALGCADGVVRFREPRNWTQIRAWPGHVHGITAMCFDMRGERLATAGRDGTVRVWDLATGAAELVLLPQRERWAAARRRYRPRTRRCRRARLVCGRAVPPAVDPHAVTR